MLARDVMTRNVLVVTPSTSVEEIARLLVTNRVSAVPVVDDNKTILGIVSEGDLLRRPETGSGRRRSWWLELLSDTPTLAADYIKSHGRHARDVMTPRVISVTEDTEVGDIADLLEHRQIKRVPVARDGKLVGIVSRADIIRALAQRQAQAPTGAADDKSIREALLAKLDAQLWAEATFINVVIKDGVVTFNGLVSSRAQGAALRVLAEGVAGVKSAEDNTQVRNLAAFAD